MSVNNPAPPERSKHVSPSRVIGSDPEQIEKAAAVVALVEEGALLKVALAQVGIKRAMFASSLSSERGLAARYARAMELSADFLVDEALEAARTEPDVQRARIISESNRWAASKRNSRRYGDRIDLNVTQTLDIGATLLEARRRMRSVSDQQDVIDAQVLDSQVFSLPKAADNESAALPAALPAAQKSESAADEPDIFG